jgi:hypothetical protein
MGTAITIKDVPDEVRDELASRAALSSRSLREYLRSQLIAPARRPDAELLLARVRDRRHRVGGRLSVESILGHIDADRPGGMAARVADVFPGRLPGACACFDANWVGEQTAAA